MKGQQHLANPHIKGIIAGEILEHAAQVEAEANGSPLAAARIRLLRQYARNLVGDYDIPREPVPQ